MSIVKINSLLNSRIINQGLYRLYSTDLLNNHYDIIIAGGGMVGTTLACALGKKSQLNSKKILLLESSKEFKWTLTDKYSNRVVALTPSTKELLQSINAWDEISQARYGSVKKMQVWDACSDAMITFNHDDMVDHVAYIVENDLLLSAVNNIAKTMPNIQIENEAKIQDYKFPSSAESTVEVCMEGGKKYTCSVLLGADGAKSKVREKMGAQYLNWDYRQMGVVATLKLSEAGNNIVAWQRFLPNGPVAFLPLTDNLSSLVWTTSTQHAKELLKMQEDEFVDALNDALWKELPKDTFVDEIMKNMNSLLENLNLPSNAVRQLPPSISSIEPGSRAAFPLGFGHSSTYVVKGVALVGDAAHRVHPLAGQGVNLGFGDVTSIANILSEAVYSGRHLGSLIHLKQYESERQRYNVPTMLAIDGLQKLYCTQLTPIVLLRSLGLQLTNAMNPVKKMILGHAVG